MITINFYSKHWKAYQDDNEVLIKNFANIHMGIKLNKGVSNIKLSKYISRGKGRI